MKTARVKSILILILTLVNVFLLVLLLGQRRGEARAYRRSVEELTALFAHNGIAFDPALLPRSVSLPALDAARDTAAEQKLAETLLGSASVIDSGGGIFRYFNENGLCLVRSSGALEASASFPVSDPAAYCASLFDAFGYCSLSAADGVFTAERTVSGVPIYNAVLRCTFSGDTLVGVSGSFLPTLTVGEALEGVDAISALVNFLDYCTGSGEVCTEIRSLSCGYLLQSTVSVPLRLTPVWRVKTDVSEYYVNYQTGEVVSE